MNSNLLTSKKNFIQIIKLLHKKTRNKLFLLLAIMILGAFAELISVGAVIPFLAVLYEPEKVLKMPMLIKIYQIIGLNYDRNIRLDLTIFFSSAAITAGLIRITIVYFTARVNSIIGHEIAVSIFSRTIHQPYHIHVSRNSSEILNGLNMVELSIAVFNASLVALSAIFVSIFIIIGILLIKPFAACLSIAGFSFFYITISYIARKSLGMSSKVISSLGNLRIQSAQESLGGIRDILLEHTQNIFIQRFNKRDYEYRKAKANIDFIAPSPRFIIEAIGMSLIAIMGYLITSTNEGLATTIPILGAIALAAQRVLPPLQQIYNGWVTIAGNRYALNKVRELMQQPLNEINRSSELTNPTLDNIQFENVSFSYDSSSKPIIKMINFSIRKGERIGIIGETGSGKSTMVDLLMGLLRPSNGFIKINGNVNVDSFNDDWQQKIAHVPQNIYLADATFAENIAFGVDPKNIDLHRVRNAAIKAKIAEFIEDSPEGYSGLVGEGGIRLSGGQRQRIGIARALYKRAEILVLDEATSALDDKTETEVMESLNAINRDMTMVLIAHRLTTLKICDVIYRLQNGVISWSGSYAQLIEEQEGGFENV